MKIHEIERNSTLEITVNPTYSHLIADVLDSQVRQVWFSDRLVYSFIFSDTSQEILFGFLGGHVLIVGISGADFESNVRSNDCRIIARRLEEDGDEPLFFRDTIYDTLSGKSINGCSM